MKWKIFDDDDAEEFICRARDRNPLLTVGDGNMVILPPSFASYCVTHDWNFLPCVVEAICIFQILNPKF